MILKRLIKGQIFKIDKEIFEDLYKEDEVN